MPSWCKKLQKLAYFDVGYNILLGVSIAYLNGTERIRHLC
jgi:hypothetical protein